MWHQQSVVCFYQILQIFTVFCWLLSSFDQAEVWQMLGCGDPSQLRESRPLGSTWHRGFTSTNGGRGGLCKSSRMEWWFWIFLANSQVLMFTDGVYQNHNFCWITKDVLPDCRSAIWQLRLASGLGSAKLLSDWTSFLTCEKSTQTRCDIRLPRVKDWNWLQRCSLHKSLYDVLHIICI